MPSDLQKIDIMDTAMRKLAEENNECRHEWRVVENFYKEISRTKRSYPAYCVYCMSCAEVVLTVDKIKN